MSDQKQSQFTEVQELIDSDFVPVFGQGSNKKITKVNLFDQIKDETQIFIYPTTEQLQAADLVADLTWPVYVRNAETEYRLYKITSLAAGVNDISLNNGLTATFQEEYSGSGFVLGPAISTDNSIALFDGVTGAQLKDGPVIGAIGESLVELNIVSDTSYIKINADESVTLRNTAQFQADLSVDQKVTGPASVADGAIAVFDGTSGKLVEAGEQMINISRRIDSWAAISAIPVSQAGQLFLLSQHTSGGLGGGTLMSFAGSVADDNVTQKNSATVGFYLKRVGYTAITPEMAGVTNYSVNNLVALQAAATAAANNNVPLKGNPSQYCGVTGNFVIPDNSTIIDLKLKQLIPASSTRTFFKNSGVGNIKLLNCAVDRNGTADAIDPQIYTDAAGVWIQNVSNVKIDGLEVFGNGQGTGATFLTLGGECDFKNIYIHDITWWTAAAPVTEKAAGFGFQNMSQFTVSNFKVTNIYSKTGTDPVRRYQTDAINFGGCTRFTLKNGYISNTGEGLDITGSIGNSDFKIHDIYAEDCGTAAFKVANGNNTGEMHSLTAVRSGQCGIGIVGTGATALQPVGNFFIHHCFIYDTGANPEVSGGSITYDGIQLAEATTQPSAPFNTILSDLLIVDRQTVKTMDYGIRRYESVFSGQNLVLGDNIIIQGAKVADVAARGVPNTLGKYMFSSIQLAAPLTHTTSGTWQTFLLTTPEFDDNGLYNTATGVFTIKTAGLYEINAFLSFASNATGYRGLRCRVTKAPAAIATLISDLKMAVTGDSTSCQVKRNIMLAAGDSLMFEFNQTSGGALNTNASTNFAQVTLLKV